jgi:hypothetical protein
LGFVFLCVGVFGGGFAVEAPGHLLGRDVTPFLVLGRTAVGTVRVGVVVEARVFVISRDVPRQGAA